jgi:uncharacterized protein YjbJ (UPF0337 family)
VPFFAGRSSATPRSAGLYFLSGKCDRIFLQSADIVFALYDGMDKTEAEGKRKQAEGEIREDVGKITDDKSEQIRGKGEKIEGKIQEGVGKAKREV